MHTAYSILHTAYWILDCGCGVECGPRFAIWENLHILSATCSRVLEFNRALTPPPWMLIYLYLKRFAAKKKQMDGNQLNWVQSPPRWKWGWYDQGFSPKREESTEMEDQFPHFQSGWLASQLSIHPLRPRAKPRLSPPLRYHHFASKPKD